MFAIYIIVFLALGCTAGVDAHVINFDFSPKKLPKSCMEYFVSHDPCTGNYRAYACDGIKEFLACLSDVLVQKCDYTLLAARNMLRRDVTYTVINGELSENDTCEELRYLRRNHVPTTKNVTTEPKPPCLDRPAVKNGDCKENAYLVGAHWTGSCDCSYGFQRNPTAAVRCVLDKHGTYTWFEEVPMCSGAKRDGYSGGIVASAFVFFYYVYF